MKKLCVLLAAVFLLSAIAPCMAVESNTYTPDSPSGYIVKLKEPQAASVVLMESAELREVSADAGLYHADSISDISALGNTVEYYEPDCTATLYALPNDPYAYKQWSIENIGISAAWNSGFNGKGVKIAVIDSGVNSMHEDFTGTSFGSGYNVINGSHDVADEMGHGTFVCGVLGAGRDNGVGIAGFCTEATIVPIKCFEASLETDASYVIRAIYEAVDMYDCDVINMSLGVDKDLESMREAVEYATSKGVIVVSAVGNSGNSVLNYPAAYDCVIGVGSVDQNGLVAAFSEKNESVFVVAPGVHILSLDYKTNNAYDDGSGTSYSTPFVSVAAAILKQYMPNATVSDFKAILQKSSVDGGITGYDTSYGYGKLNIKNFVNEMENYVAGNIGVIFPDVEGHWAEQSIGFCVANKLFLGTSSNSFEPEITMNRAMLVTVLSRMSGETISGFANSFSDVPSTEWYAQPCAWGATKGIVSGIGNGTFEPLSAVTREQMAVLLYRYAAYYGLTGAADDESALAAFTDAGDISSWAKEAMAWAVGNGLITGRSASTLCPKNSAARCEVATVISRFANAFGM